MTPPFMQCKDARSSALRRQQPLQAKSKLAFSAVTWGMMVASVLQTVQQVPVQQF